MKTLQVIKTTAQKEDTTIPVVVNTYAPFKSRKQVISLAAFVHMLLTTCKMEFAKIDKQFVKSDEQNSVGDKQNSDFDNENSVSDKHNSDFDIENSVGDKQNSDFDNENSVGDKQNSDFDNENSVGDKQNSDFDNENSVGDKQCKNSGNKRLEPAEALIINGLSYINTQKVNQGQQQLMQLKYQNRGPPTASTVDLKFKTFTNSIS